MKRCKICRKKPRLERRINSAGVLFCSDACYDQLDHPDDDFDHPYVSDYEGIRSQYIRWINGYEDRLHHGMYYGHPKKHDLIEEIEELHYDFLDYEGLGGMDGIYSAEIFTYLRLFDELITTITEWQRNDKTYRKWHRQMEREKEQKRREWEEKYNAGSF